MDKYSYDGPVMRFDKCVESHFKCETMAASEKKARSNIAYNWKKKNNVVPGAKVTLPGKIIKEESN